LALCTANIIIEMPVLILVLFSKYMPDWTSLVAHNFLSENNCSYNARQLLEC